MSIPGYWSLADFIVRQVEGRFLKEMTTKIIYCPHCGGVWDDNGRIIECPNCRIRRPGDENAGIKEAKAHLSKTQLLNKS